MIPVPEEYLAIYNDTWKRFADLIKNIYLKKCSCTSIIIRKVFRFLKAAEFDLEADRLTRFINNITAANNLLKYTI